MSVAKAESGGVRAQKKRETQRLLTQTGMRLFLEQGYAETTLDQIAAEAGVSRRTIFSYFASKEDILVASSDDGWEDILGDIRAARPDEQPLAVVCNSLLGRISTRSNKDLLALRQLMLLSATLRSKGQVVFFEREHAVMQALVEVWPEPGRQWEIRLAAMASVGAFRLVVDTWRDSPEELSLQTLTEQCFEQLEKLWLNASKK